MKKNYKLLVHFNEYTGNFHEFFTKYVCAFDREAGDPDSVKKTLDYFFSDMDVSDDKKRMDAENEFCECFLNFYDEYGTTISELTIIPDKNKTEEYNCNGITVFFDKYPFPILPKIMERIKTFPEALASSNKRFSSMDVKVLKVELIEEEVTQTIKELTL